MSESSIAADLWQSKILTVSTNGSVKMTEPMRHWRDLVDTIIGDYGVSDHLKAWPADAIHWQDSNGNTLLHLAAKYLNGVAIRELVELGAKTDVVNAEGHIPFIVGAIHCRDELCWWMLSLATVKRLFELSAGIPTFDVNMLDANGYTPLALVLQRKEIGCGHDNVITFLLSKGAKWALVKYSEFSEEELGRFKEHWWKKEKIRKRKGILDTIRQGAENERCRATVVCILGISRRRNSVWSGVPRDIIRLIGASILKTAPPVWIPKYE